MSQIEFFFIDLAVDELRAWLTASRARQKEGEDLHEL